MSDPSGIAHGMTTGLFEAFKASPVLLLIVVLNAFFCAGATYYLLRSAEYRHMERQQEFDLLARCIISPTEARK